MPTIDSPASKAMVLMTYFGRKEGQTIMDFNNELKELSVESKNELATLAAKELGVELKD